MDIGVREPSQEELVVYSKPSDNLDTAATLSKDIDEALSAVGIGLHQLFLFLYVGGCWMSDAMEVMLVAVLAPAVACEWSISPEGQSILASSVFTGMMLASSAWGIVADLAGRKVAFGMAAGIAATAGLFSAVAPSFGWLVALRLLVGFGLVGVLPMYSLLEEWIPKASGSKGKWLVALQAWWSIGTVLEALLAWWLLNTCGWRALLAASVAPIACILAALPWVPESPQYLAAAGRLPDAYRVLARAAACNGTTAALSRHMLVRQQQDQQQEREELLGCQEKQEQQQQQRDSRHRLQGQGDQADRSRGRISADGVSDAGSPSAVHLEVETPSPALSSRNAGAEVLYDRQSDGGDGESQGDERCGGGGGRFCRCLGVNKGAGWLRGLADLAGTLLGAQLRGRTLRLAVTWFASALSYYGVVMLVPYVAAGDDDGAEAGGRTKGAGTCVPWSDEPGGDVDGGGGGGSHLVLPRGTYLSMMAAAAAELPSLAWAFLAVDRWSRHRTVAIGLAATAAALAPLVMARSGGGGVAAATGASTPPPPPASPAPAAASGNRRSHRRRLQPAPLTATASSWLPLASVTLARLFVSGAFTLLYVLTPEQFPPRVRSSALGAANSLARLGSLAAPFVAVALPLRGALPEAMATMVVACGVAAMAVGGLPEAWEG